MIVVSVSRVVVAESALRDLEEVQAEYAAPALRDVEGRRVDEVFRGAHALIDHPDMGRVVPEFDQTFLRGLIHLPLRIVVNRLNQHVEIKGGALSRAPLHRGNKRHMCWSYGQLR